MLQVLCKNSYENNPSKKKVLKAEEAEERHRGALRKVGVKNSWGG